MLYISDKSRTLLRNSFKFSLSRKIFLNKLSFVGSKYFSISITPFSFNRLLSKLAYAEGFEGDAEPRPAAYSNVREEQNTGITYKSPAEVEFRKKSNIINSIIF
ncbi:MAG: palindromic element RPE1 domain-containing protein [Candidatus Tisiphia sp.]